MIALHYGLLIYCLKMASLDVIHCSQPDTRSMLIGLSSDVHNFTIIYHQLPKTKYNDESNNSQFFHMKLHPIQHRPLFP